MIHKVSVIVTIYNTEKYLSRCLDSLANQTFMNLEIILVNDGSKDKCEEICRRYVDSDPRFRLINKTNGGVSSARNIGMQNARGNYIAFVDSDDYVSPDMYQILVDSINKYKGDLVVCSFFYDYGNKIKEEKARKPFGMFYQKDYFFQICSDAYSFYYGVVWNKLFCRSMIQQHNISFDEKINYMEDWDFLMNYLRYANQIIKIPNHLYYYNRVNAQSITLNNSNFELSYINRMQGYLGLYELSEWINCYQQRKDLIHAYLLRYIISQKYKILSSENKKEAYQIHRIISKRNEVRSVISTINKWIKLKMILYYNLKYSIEAIIEIARKRFGYRFGGRNEQSN